jgi:DNA-binding response OmpR family regulator
MYGSKFSLLLIEDDESTIKLLNYFFSKHNFNIDTASDGSIALSKLLEKTYDIIITDIFLPKLNGLEVIEKANHRLSNSLVIVLTANGDKSNIQKAQSLNVKLYLLKPITPSKLLLKIANSLQMEVKAFENETKNFSITTKRILNEIEVYVNGKPKDTNIIEAFESIQNEIKNNKVPKSLIIHLSPEATFEKTTLIFLDLLVEKLFPIFKTIKLSSDYIDTISKKELNDSKFLNQCKIEKSKKE